MSEFFNYIVNNPTVIYILTTLISVLKITVPLIISVAYLTYMERKVIGLMQLRTGPSVVGFFGLLQPFADALKLMFKELIFPIKSNKKLFILAPILTFILAMIGWAVIPLESQNGIPLAIANINVGVLYLLGISSLGVYSIIIAGWASNSNYAFLGAIRSASQMISYEVSMGLVLVTVILCTGTLNFSEIIVARHNMPIWMDILLFPMGIVFFISVLAETNRHPFDLPEAESELVSGYNVEYSSTSFALFFLGEYANMILFSAITSVLFLGSIYPPFNIEIFNQVPGIIWLLLKIFLLLFLFIWIRATTPRYRYDQLMRIGWKFFLPLSLIWVVIISAVITFVEI